MKKPAQKYDHKKVEQKWQKAWNDAGVHKVTRDGKKEKEYVLVEFPYPSGDLHVGHWYAFAVPDIYARTKRMQGKNVLFPIGFDSFGLPAENAAIKHGLNPRKWTYSNMDTMRVQMQRMGASFDTSRELATSDPEYYKWTQWMFTQFYDAGLVKQKETPANWCPSCKTVLANEQVINNMCERCDTEVEKKNMKQWSIGITKYADRLIDDLAELDWPQQIKDSQINWIGKSEGAEIDFSIKDSEEKIKVFTTRPDTLFGATYMVLAPEHALVEALAEKVENIDGVRAYVKDASKKSHIERGDMTKEKTGVELKGIKAINPTNNEEIPVYIADYVMADYGTGAIMAVPAHDERDFEFAKKFGIEIIVVIDEDTVFEFGGEYTDLNDQEKIEKNFKKQTTPYIGVGKLRNSDKFDGMESEEAKQAITKLVGGKMKATYKLRDWNVSRQRYWGVPIPMVHCGKCGTVPVPSEQLPVGLPNIDDYLPRDDGKSPLAKVTDWVNVACPKCGGSAERETDTLDTFVDSSWYYLRYTDIDNTDEFASKTNQKKWAPVDLYLGGAEHTTMHLLYSRFWHKALFDLGLVADKEPYTRRMNRGLIMGPDGHKMSKSKGNVINPDEIVAELGADTVRTYLAFIGPYNETGSYPWSPDGIGGMRKFLERIWRLKEKISEKADDATEKVLHKTIKKVTEDNNKLKFNTAISALMIFINTAEKDGITKGQYETLLTLLSPFAPHITQELWESLGNDTFLIEESWPVYDESKLVEDTFTLAVQVNGKVRAELETAVDASEDEVRELALSNEAVDKWVKSIGKGEIKRFIYITGRLANIVVQ